MRLGKKQIEFLAVMAATSRTCLTSDKATRSLVDRGILRSDEHGATCMTPAGYRAVADLIEAGIIKDAITLSAERKAAKEKTDE